MAADSFSCDWKSSFWRPAEEGGLLTQGPVGAAMFSYSVLGAWLLKCSGWQKLAQVFLWTVGLFYLSWLGGQSPEKTSVKRRTEPQRRINTGSSNHNMPFLSSAYFEDGSHSNLVPLTFQSMIKSESTTSSFSSCFPSSLTSFSFPTHKWLLFESKSVEPDHWRKSNFM